MTVVVLLEAAASLLMVELSDEVVEELLAPELLPEYERLPEYEQLPEYKRLPEYEQLLEPDPLLNEELVRFLLLVEPDFLDQVVYFLLVEREPL